VSNFVGIDPGANGCMCILRDDVPEFIDFKSAKLQGYIDHIPMSDDILSTSIEHVFSRTGQGVKSVFSFGQRLGELEGMLQTLAIPYNLVSPQRWQKFCGVVPKSGKQGVYDAISALYPNAPLLGPRGGLLDGRCDALAIAHYTKHTYKEVT